MVGRIRICDGPRVENRWSSPSISMRILSLSRKTSRRPVLRFTGSGLALFSTPQILFICIYLTQFQILTRVCHQKRMFLIINLHVLLICWNKSGEVGFPKWMLVSPRAAYLSYLTVFYFILGSFSFFIVFDLLAGNFKALFYIKLFWNYLYYAMCRLICKTNLIKWL